MTRIQAEIRRAFACSHTTHTCTFRQSQGTNTNSNHPLPPTNDPFLKWTLIQEKKNKATRESLASLHFHHHVTLRLRQLQLLCKLILILEIHDGLPLPLLHLSVTAINSYPPSSTISKICTVFVKVLTFFIHVVLPYRMKEHPWPMP